MKTIGTFIKIIASIEVIVVFAMIILAFFKWRGEYIVPSRIDMWSSRGIEYNSGWYADENLVNEGVVEKNGETEVLFGPYISLEKGDYLVSIEYEANQNQSFCVCAFEQNDKIKCSSNVLPYNSLGIEPMGLPTVSSYDFFVSEPIDNAEVRISYNGYGFIKIKNISIVKSAHRYRLLLKFALIIFLCLDIVLGVAFAMVKCEKVRSVLTYAGPIIMLVITICYCFTFILLEGKLYIDESMSRYPGVFLFTIRGFFTNNWMLARAIVTALGLIIYSGAFILICLQLDIDIRYSMIMSSLLVMPFSIANIKMITFGTHQLMEGIVTLLIVNIIIKTNLNNRNYLWLSVFISLAFMCYYLIQPLTYVGLENSYYSYQMKTGIDGLPVFEILSVALSVFGWCQGNIMSSDEFYDSRFRLFGQNFGNYIAFLLITLIILCFVGLINRWKYLRNADRFMVTLFTTMSISNTLSTLCFLRSNRVDFCFWIHIVPMGFLMLLIWHKYQDVNFKWCDMLIVSGLFIIISIFSVKDFEREPSNHYQELAHIEEFLLYNNLTKGSSADEYSYVLEELSSGLIDIGQLTDNSMEDGFFVINKSEYDSHCLDEEIVEHATVLYENSTGFCVYKL